MSSEVCQPHFPSVPSSSGFTAHMSDCGRGRCPRPWWIWPGAWWSAGAWETLGQRWSRDRNRTATRSGGEGWTWTFCTQWKTSVQSAAPLRAALEVRITRKGLLCSYKWFLCCITSSDELGDCSRCQWAGPVPRADCHGVAGCEDGVRKWSTAAQDQKPLGAMLLGRGLDREVGVCMCVFFCASSLMLHVT